MTELVFVVQLRAAEAAVVAECSEPWCGVAGREHPSDCALGRSL
jgi:hypothetical protein